MAYLSCTGSRKTGHIVLFFWLAEADSRLYAEFELFQLVRECIQTVMQQTIIKLDFDYVRIESRAVQGNIRHIPQDIGKGRPGSWRGLLSEEIRAKNP